MALIALAEIRPHILGPLVGLGQNEPTLIILVDGGADSFDGDVRFRQVFAVGAVALDQVRDCVHAEAVDAHVQPEPHDVDDFLDNARVVEVQVGLVRKEAVPVILVCNGIPGPVGFFRVGKDDAGIGVQLVRVGPHVKVTLGRARGREPSRLEPGVLIGGVVDNQLHHDLHIALVGGVQEQLEVVDRAVTGVDRKVIGDVVAVIAQGRRKKRQEPEAGNAQILQVVELGQKAGKVADAVVVGVGKSTHVELVNNGVFVPEWIGDASLPLQAVVSLVMTKRCPGCERGSRATKFDGPRQL